MEKELLEQFKVQLLAEKQELEKMLNQFAKKNPNDNDWETRYPDIAPGENIEDQVNEVEEYENLLPVERALESKLKDVDAALKRIEENTYGKCEKCNKEIPIERLRAFPEAKMCGECK